jgi:flagellar protein FlgJ
MLPTTTQAAVYTDLQSLDRLKGAAREQSPEALRAVAKQFEAVFIQMMLSSMRTASLGDGSLLDNDQSLLYRDMFDHQVALTMAEKGQLGLADMLVQQLGGAEAAARPAGTAGPGDLLTAQRLQAYTARSGPPTPFKTTAGAESAPADPAVPFPSSSPEAFVQHMWPYAQQAARRLGQSPEVLIAQAALESSWGKSVPRATDGRSSHNLFGIKADKGWDGEKMANLTLEFVDGLPVKRRDGFRAYDSFAESFNDYADFLHSNPRYRKALDQQGDGVSFLRALQDAGYATDPSYAAKIEGVLKGPVSNVLNGLKSAGARPIPVKG